MNLPDVTVVVLNWNRWHDTQLCIESILKSSYASISIVLVDNGSTDQSEDQLRKRFPDIELIQTGKNLGYAGGNNVGIRRAMELGAKYVLVLNNDCQIAEDCISLLVEVAKEDKMIGMISPKVYAHGNVISHAGSVFSWRDWYITSSIGAGQRDEGQFDTQYAIQTATGDCLLVNVDMIKTVGLLDETYFLYYEDTDWCYRARMKGYLIMYAPYAKATHPGSLSTGGINRPTGAYYVLRNKIYFVFKYGTLLAKLTNGAHILLSLAKNVLALVVSKEREVARVRLKAIFDVLMGIRGKAVGIS